MDLKKIKANLAYSIRYVSDVRTNILFLGFLPSSETENVFTVQEAPAYCSHSQMSNNEK